MPHGHLGRLMLHPQFDGIRYLLRDEFYGAVAAGAVDGTAATPGPGTRTVVDTDGDALSVGSGVLDFANPNTKWGDPGLWLDAVTRASGRFLKCSALLTVANKAMAIGFHAAQQDKVQYGGLRFRSGGTVAADFGGANGPDVFAYSGVTYDIVIVLRTAGYYWFAKIGGTWKLLFSISAGTTTPLYPGATPYDSTDNVAYIRVPKPLYLPTPLAYDTFTGTNGTSLDAHASDTVGPDSQAVVSRAWVEQRGAWEIQGNRASAAAPRPASPRFIATMDCGEADVVRTGIINLGASSAAAYLVMRYSNLSNFWSIYAKDSTNVFVIEERNAGVTTVRATAGVAIAASTDYDVQAVADGQDITAYLDDANRITYGSAVLNETATIHGLRAADVDAQFDNFLVFTRSGGAYSDLDDF